MIPSATNLGSNRGMGGVVVVFDLGKTNAKLVGFDTASGTEIWSRIESNEPRQGELYPSADIEALEAFLLDGLADLGRAADGILDGIIVTTHGASGALLAGEQLALPVLDYEHKGPDDTSDTYSALRPPFAETFSPRLPAGLNLGAQLFWLQHCFSKQFASATTFVTYPQLWAFKLCGVAATEVTSLGCHTDLWAPLQGGFSTLVSKANWRGLMAPCRRAGDVLGLMRSELSHHLGLKCAPRIFCGLQDSNASLVPHLGGSTPRSILSSGTWAILFARGGSLSRLDEARDTCANVDVFGEPVPTARFMGGREFNALTGGVNLPPSLPEITHVLDTRAMGLPGFSPGCGPFPRAVGRWTVGPETLTPGERGAVGSLYLALMSKCCLDLIGASGDTIVGGPFADNTLFCNALATLSGRPLSTSQGRTATGAGAARLMLPDLPKERPASVPGLPIALHQALFSYAAQWTALAGA